MNSVAIQTVTTVILAVLTAIYVLLVYVQGRDHWRSARASLLDGLLRGYFSAEMGAAIKALRDWRQRYEGHNFESDFATALSAREPYSDAAKLDEGPRRHVSQFYTRLRVLCDAGLVESKLIGNTLGHEAVDFFLNTVDPLDRAQRTAYGRPPSDKNRRFFERLLEQIRGN
jgi:hypothetical protein